MLFRRLTVTYFLSLIALSFTTGFWFFSQKDSSDWEEVLQNKKNQALKSLEKAPSSQIREGTEKLFWKQERSSFPSLHCLSRQSSLRLSQKKKHIECVEELSDITLHLYHPSSDVCSIHADTASLLLKDSSCLYSLNMQGNIRFFCPNLEGSPAYALAETVSYSPDTPYFLLSSSKNVLFWQEGVSLSTPTLYIHPFPSLKIQSVGPAHFQFTKEETNIINDFISQYL